MYTAAWATLGVAPKRLAETSTDMPRALVTASHQYFTGIPRDVAVNTFHFDTGQETVTSVSAGLAQLVQDFYATTPSGSSNPIDYYLGAVIPRTTESRTIRVYDMSQPMPRPPVLSVEYELQPAGGNSTLPLEVSIVCSFAAEGVPGIPPARRRGRIYLGPLGFSAINAGTTSDLPSVPSAVRAVITGAAFELAVDSRAADLPWCVYSRVSSTLAPVYRGWVDNEPDTQRRREGDATERTTWSLSI